ncbi:MAG: hypothetical protein L6Q78_04980, partial [Bacteroidia bacterium]|nr:hypothetical protein [Bacteroidia bacterium]
RIENGITTQLSNTHIEQLSLSRFTVERGAKRYELTNHLGNVLTVVTDKKIPVCNGTTISYFIADVVSATDYSPFGAPLAGRTWQVGEYRYGFNTQERDDEIAGFGNIMTAEYWEYDTRLGRRWNVDPVDQIFVSNYSVNGLNPIIFCDPNGDLFGIKGFGSTSEQRKAAKSFAKEHDGKVNNLLRKSINVTYSKYERLPVTGRGEMQGETQTNFSAGLYLADKEQYFNPDGSAISELPQYTSLVPTSMENWSESRDLFGKLTYNFANGTYTAAQIFTAPITGGYYNLTGSEQTRGSSELLDNFVSGSGILTMGTTGSYAMGPLKNWIRVGPSYSIEGGFNTFAIRWGAGGQYWKNIPSTSLQNANKILRQLKIPVNNWRTNDPGHLHIFKE